MFKAPDPAIAVLMRKAGDKDLRIATEGQYQLAQALSLPLQEALLADNIINGIFTPIDRTGQKDLDYPLDILNPGDEEDFVAYVQPGNGRIPERQVQADYVHLRTYMIANSIDVLLRILRDADWDIMSRMLEVLRAGFQMKMNRDGWRILLSAGAGRGTVVYDSANTTGVLTRRLIQLMQVEMRRQGGTFTALKRRKLTHLYVAPEAKQDVYSWNLDQVDDVTRRELYVSSNDQGSLKVAGTFITDIDELGVGYEFNDYYVDTLGQTLPGSDTEIVVGLDLQNPSFVMPIREFLSINSDPNMHRSQKAGFYGWFEGGYAALDDRDILIGSI